MAEFSQYATLRGNGADPKEVYLAAKVDGLDLIDCIRVLREVYSLTIVEAKGVCVEVDTGMTLDEYEESLLPEIEAAFAVLVEDLEK